MAAFTEVDGVRVCAYLIARASLAHPCLVVNVDVLNDDLELFARAQRGCVLDCSKRERVVRLVWGQRASERGGSVSVSDGECDGVGGQVNE
jgi:hypothetical protein